jgi:hypothetical protein
VLLYGENNLKRLRPIRHGQMNGKKNRYTSSHATLLGSPARLAAVFRTASPYDDASEVGTTSSY